MNTKIAQRQEWEIDKRLSALIGENVRIRIAAFLPDELRARGTPSVKVSALVLPDNTSVTGDIFFEGVLRGFRREIAVVYAALDPLPFRQDAANGRVLLRGLQAVILQGNAVVELDPRHFIEKLPADPRLYWEHLVATGPQIKLPLER